MAVTLEPVDGSTGQSVTEFSTLADSTPLNFDELLIFDGHIIIHPDAGNTISTLTSANIGQNSANNPNI